MEEGGKDRGRGDCRRVDSRRTMLPGNVIIFGYCIRSCSSLVSLGGVVKNHRTCKKAFYIWHYIFFALARVRRAAFAADLQPHSPAQHSEGTCHTVFQRHFLQGRAGHCLDCGLGFSFWGWQLSPCRRKGSAFFAHQDYHRHMPLPISPKCVSHTLCMQGAQIMPGETELGSFNCLACSFPCTAQCTILVLCMQSKSKEPSRKLAGGCAGNK